MKRFRSNLAPLLVLSLFTFGMSASGQDLFEQRNPEPKDASATEAKKGANEKESIF